MLIPASKNIFRWKSNDPELGIDQYGTMLLKGDMVAVVDPPMVPGLIEAIRMLGKPTAVIITNFQHSRGCKTVAGRLGTDLFIPDIMGRDGQGIREEVVKLHLEKAKKYNESTTLPLQIKPHCLRPETEKGIVVVDEMALQFGDVLILGDSAWGINGKINYFPANIIPDEGKVMETANRKALETLVKKTGSRTLIAGHGEVLTGKFL